MIDLNKLKFLFMDVDGTLTDGKIYMSENGELFKAFDVKDGCGIKDILPSLGIAPVIITARNSKILSRRCEELGIDRLYQNTRNKTAVIQKIMSTEGYVLNDSGVYEEAAYIGDDILDISPMKICALKACPADAVDEVKDICDYISTKPAGNGAVRELIDFIQNN